MTDTMNIRQGTIADIDTLVTFNLAMAGESEGLTLEEPTVRRGLEWLLQHPDVGPYYVAERSGTIVGQCMVTYEWSEWRNAWVWWFQSVYVHPDHRRGGVFRALYAHVQTLARQRDDVYGLRLYVERNNASAIRTYESLGMRPSGHVVYELDLPIADR